MTRGALQNLAADGSRHTGAAHAALSSAGHRLRQTALTRYLNLKAMWNR